MEFRGGAGGKGERKRRIEISMVVQKAQRKQKPHNANKKNSSQRKQKSHNANKKIAHNGSKFATKLTEV